MCKIMLTLKAARINVNLTQNQAAKLLNVSNDIISNWERGKTLPNAEQIRKIVDLYKVPYENLIFLPK
ncbi:helix-turn-helix transcriptional regulator [Dialister invisus]|uniref:helix-turn-helix transcriptional regulator n=1 Tax=Dialister invisus TaxID=218538 RepID=UPI003AB55E4D